ncbi:hypothetical protein K491DRAFT_277833 [Lophiostoma macrostomum CBS 122681]|uniref:Uncharacterized protein n=1 Tax=Lophiostoma macrostomum CBS 122681 TaxID=1314788 RepID=A0A6A6SNQ3_9PLEO|nr:hypothetical protein K491DRAFT_277833 [Lophiostoma macrostomum CBS 122681]
MGIPAGITRTRVLQPFSKLKSGHLDSVRTVNRTKTEIIAPCIRVGCSHGAWACDSQGILVQLQCASRMSYKAMLTRHSGQQATSSDTSDPGLSLPQSQMQNPQMLQHYRMRQRKYWEWRCQSLKTNDEPNYYPPHLRQLRLDWFAKRLEKYGGAEPMEKLNQSPEVDHNEDPQESDSEALASKIWSWLIDSDEDAKRERSKNSTGK